MRSAVIRSSRRRALGASLGMLSTVLLLVDARRARACENYAIETVAYSRVSRAVVVGRIVEAYPYPNAEELLSPAPAGYRLLVDRVVSGSGLPPQILIGQSDSCDELFLREGDKVIAALGTVRQPRAVDAPFSDERHTMPNGDNSVFWVVGRDGSLRLAPPAPEIVGLPPVETEQQLLRAVARLPATDAAALPRTADPSRRAHATIVTVFTGVAFAVTVALLGPRRRHRGHRPGP